MLCYLIVLHLISLSFKEFSNEEEHKYFDDHKSINSLPPPPVISKNDSTTCV